MESGGRYPGKFAAVMPVCGGASIACAAKIGRVPLRAYHAADDPVVPPTGEMRPPFPYGDAPLYGSRLAVSEATRSGDPFAEYIEYPAGMIGEKWGHPHASWEEAFRDPQAISWMFRQSRLDLYEISCPTPGVWEISDSLNDVAGIRVICPFINDIYDVADMLLRQDDVKLVSKKDYIKNPKENGYRSLHLVIEIPVFFSTQKEMVRVEIQIRTVAMDFWASLEHQIRYKNYSAEVREIADELKECADIIAQTDLKMQQLRQRMLPDVPR